MTTNEVSTTAVVRHNLLHCPLNTTVPAVSRNAVSRRMQKAAMKGQLRMVKELYKSLLADKETGA